MTEQIDCLKDGFDEMMKELRKEAPVKCQSCECLEANFRDGDKGQGWYMDCYTKPDCYQEDEVHIQSSKEQEKPQP